MSAAARRTPRSRCGSASSRWSTASRRIKSCPTTGSSRSWTRRASTSPAGRSPSTARRWKFPLPCSAGGRKISSFESVVSDLRGNAPGLMIGLRLLTPPGAITMVRPLKRGHQIPLRIHVAGQPGTGPDAANGVRRTARSDDPFEGTSRKAPACGSAAPASRDTIRDTGIQGNRWPASRAELAGNGTHSVRSSDGYC